MPTESAQSSEAAVRDIFERWAASVRAEDLAGIRGHHASNMLMFDVPPPFASRGLDAYMATWATFYRSQVRPIVFDFADLEITAGDTVAFLTATGRCLYIEKTGEHNDLRFRLTMGLRKKDGQWWIVHEHHSVPASD